MVTGSHYRQSEETNLPEEAENCEGVENMTNRKVPCSSTGYTSPAGLDAVGQVDTVLPVDEGASGESTGKSADGEDKDHVHRTSLARGDDPSGGAHIHPAEEGD